MVVSVPIQPSSAVASAKADCGEVGAVRVFRSRMVIPAQRVLC